jgi:nucleoside diphosphate kinase
MGSGPICAMVWEGRDAVKTGRGMFSSNLAPNTNTNNPVSC